MCLGFVKICNFTQNMLGLLENAVYIWNVFKMNLG